MTITQHVLCLSLVAATAAGCSGRPGAAADGAAAAAGAPEATPAGLDVPEARQRQWGISLGQAEHTAGSDVVTLPGVLRFDEGRTIQVNSLVSGQVTSLAADLGARVRKGQVLATIHSPAVAQAKTAFLQAASRAELAARDYERGRTLLQQEAIDQKELLRRRAESEHAASDLGAAESQLHSLGFDQTAVDGLLQRGRQADARGPQDDLTAPYLRLTSSIDGRVIERHALTGQHVEPDKLLFVVSDLTTLWAALDAREGDLPLLAAGRAVRIRTGVYPDRSWDGRITYVGDTVDERSRTVKVRVETRNDGLLLKPNMFVQGEIAGAAGSRRDVLTVPDEAVQTINGETVVFVRLASGRFVATPVEAAERRGNRRVVLRGLDGTEAVVVSGAFNLKAELLKSSLSGE